MSQLMSRYIKEILKRNPIGNQHDNQQGNQIRHLFDCVPLKTFLSCLQFDFACYFRLAFLVGETLMTGV